MTQTATRDEEPEEILLKTVSIAPSVEWGRPAALGLHGHSFLLLRILWHSPHRAEAPLSEKGIWIFRDKIVVS
jgi:hypothetical protein